MPTTCNIPIISLGSFHEVALVNPSTGVVMDPLFTGLSSPHGLDFVPAIGSQFTDLNSHRTLLTWL